MTGRRSMTVAAAAPDDADIPTRFLALDTEALVSTLLDPDAVAAHGDDRVDPETIHAVLEAIAAAVREERPWRDPAVLATLYYEEGRTQSEIGQRLGTSQRTITRWMRKYDLSPDSRTPETFAGLADLGLVDRLLDDTRDDTDREHGDEPAAVSWGAP